jgi:hypothetical protein
MYFPGSEIPYQFLQLCISLWGNFIHRVRYANSTKYEYMRECGTSKSFLQPKCQIRRAKSPQVLYRSVYRHVIAYFAK